METEKKIIGFGGKFFELKADCVVDENKIVGDFEEVYPLSGLSFADLKAMWDWAENVELTAQLEIEMYKRTNLKYF